MAGYTISINQQKIDVTRTEFQLYKQLSECQEEQKECVTYLQFAQDVQGWSKNLSWNELEQDDQLGIIRGYRVHVSNLNKKITNVNPKMKIQSVEATGYRLPEFDDTVRPDSSDAMLSYDESSSDFYLLLKKEAALFPIDDTMQEWTIGRNPSVCNIYINNRKVSKVHATIFPAPGGWFIYDEGSLHGTYIHSQGERYKAEIGKENAKLLRDEDLIEIARDLFYKFRDFSS